MFGLKSVEEMCFFTFLYYPAKQILGQRQWGCGMDLPLSACNASFISDQYSLSDTQSLSPTELDTFYEREFGSQSSNQCSFKPPLTFTTSDNNNINLVAAASLSLNLASPVICSAGNSPITITTNAPSLQSLTWFLNAASIQTGVNNRSWLPTAIGTYKVDNVIVGIS